MEATTADSHHDHHHHDRRRRGQSGRPGATPSATPGCSAWSSRWCRSSPGASVEATGLGVFWCFGPLFVFGVMPLLDIAGRRRRRPTRPTASSSGSSRTATTAGAPTSSSRSSTPASSSPATCGRAATCRLLESLGLALTVGVVGGIAINTAHELGHKRASSERWLSQGRPRPDRLRPLLHRAQPRPPRPRRHAGGPGQLAAGGELLGLPAAHGHRQPHARPGRSRARASTASASRTGRCTTTSSTPGR